MWLLVLLFSSLSRSHTHSLSHTHTLSLLFAPVTRPSELLTDMCSFLRSMSWLENIEFRKRAKVPILNLIHRSQIEVDIRYVVQCNSCGVAAVVWFG